MAKKNPIFIIPGFRHNPKSKAYIEIAKMLKTEGYSPIPVTIPWRESTISQNTDYFLKKYKKVNSRKKYIIGFSLGAMIAFLASTKVNVSGLMLCSLSPYFKEDLLKVNDNWSSYIMKQRYQDFSKLHCQTLAKKIKAKKVLLLYGAKEARLLIKRVRDVYNQISTANKYLIPVLKTEHNIGDRRYLNKIHQITKELN